VSDSEGHEATQRGNLALKVPHVDATTARRSDEIGGLESSAGRPSGDGVRTAGWAGGWLKAVLRTLDLLALTVGWWLAYRTMVAVGAAYPQTRLPMALLALSGIAASLTVMASKRLWLARVCVVRSAELAGLGQTAVVGAMSVLAVGQLVDYDAPDRFALLGALYSFVLLVTMRSIYAASLQRARRNGRLARTLVLVGMNAQARDLARLIQQHPETGYDIVGMCGPRHQMGADLDVPWLGGYDQAADAVERADATGALVVASALDHDRLNRTLRRLLATSTCRAVCVASRTSACSHSHSPASRCSTSSRHPSHVRSGASSGSSTWPSRFQSSSSAFP
jgi:FlaA1/EpsC-like NDP-sugar epimerase